MKKSIAFFVIMTWGLCVCAQEIKSPAFLYNEENQVFMEINFAENNIAVPQQEIIGEVPGYIGIQKDYRKWLIVDVVFINSKSARLSIINDYGSEDFIATLTINADGTYTFKHVDGSPLKFVVNKKWAKMPKTLHFKITDKTKIK